MRLLPLKPRRAGHVLSAENHCCVPHRRFEFKRSETSSERKSDQKFGLILIFDGAKKDALTGGTESKPPVRVANHGRDAQSEKLQFHAASERESVAGKIA